MIFKNCIPDSVGSPAVDFASLLLKLRLYRGKG